jgi:hypothetical protein
MLHGGTLNISHAALKQFVMMGVSRRLLLKEPSHLP